MGRLPAAETHICSIYSRPNLRPRSGHLRVLQPRELQATTGAALSICCSLSSRWPSRGCRLRVSLQEVSSKCWLSVGPASETPAQRPASTWPTPSNTLVPHRLRTLSTQTHEAISLEGTDEVFCHLSGTERTAGAR